MTGIGPSIETPEVEIARSGDYDYIVTNETGRVEKTADKIEASIAEEHRRHPTRRVRV